ncbi:MAG: GNAT family N-acetyltransferase [Salinivirgaceae bacterium]|nr:GNAT family N-acetyltransferase [Salinivirgaceae bacterium]
MSEFNIVVASEEHIKYVDEILETIAAAAKVRGTGIAKRNPEYVKQKMAEGKAVIALHGEEQEFAGFSYIETWDNKQYVTTSGLIVKDKFRGMGLSRLIKHMTFSLARRRWPEAKIFSLTSGAAVMKLNTQHGYKPVTFAQLTNDEAFWHGCEGCINFDVLQRTGRRYCICTGMLFDPKDDDCVAIAQKELDLDPKCKATMDQMFGKLPNDKAGKNIITKLKSIIKK